MVLWGDGISVLFIDGKLLDGCVGIFLMVNLVIEEVLGVVVDVDVEDMGCVIEVVWWVFDLIDWFCNIEFWVWCVW